MRSPFTLSFRRSTPWVDGCCGPKLSSMSSASAKRASGFIVSRRGSLIGSGSTPGLAGGRCGGRRRGRRRYRRGSRGGGRRRGGRRLRGRGRFRWRGWRCRPRRCWRLGRLPAGAGAGDRAGALLVVLGVDRRAGVDPLDGEVLAQREAVEPLPEEDAGHVRVARETHAVHVVDLALRPVGGPP